MSKSYGFLGGPMESRCSLCGRLTTPLSLWCERCLLPFVKAGQKFQTSIPVIRKAIAA